LIEAGYKTGLYTSPHIEEVNERIRVNGTPISDKMFKKYERFVYEKITRKGSSYRTYFEALTAMAFLYFADKKTDFAVIETGLGGRLDSTNVVSPAVSIITVIDYDHKDILGSALKQIAHEKAGIIKKGRPVFIFNQEREVEDEVKRKAEKENSKVVFVDRKKCIKKSGNVFEYKEKTYKTYQPGSYQMDNSILAIEALRYLNIDEKYIKRGIKNFRIKGRMELLKNKPDVYADGSHNPAAIQKTMKEFASMSKGEIFVIACFMADKEYKISLSIIERYTKNIYLTSIPFFRSAKCKDYKDIGFPCFKTPKDAYREVMKKTKSRDTIIFIGSFYLISYARRAVKN